MPFTDYEVVDHPSRRPGTRIRFHARDISLALMNSLRRVLLSSIPNVALDPATSQCTTNTTKLHNEIMTHRLSLLPICMSPDEIAAFDPDAYVFRIAKKNTGKDRVYVTTDDITVVNAEGRAYPKADRDRWFPKNPLTGDAPLITRLEPHVYDKDLGDEFVLEARASISTATVHAAWSPVSLCTLYNAIDPTLADAAFEGYVERQAHLAIERDELRRRFNTLEAFRCFQTNEWDEPVDIVFELQSECGMSPAFLMFKAFRVIVAGFEELARGDPSRLEITAVPETRMYQYVLQGYTHTHAHLLQNALYKRMKDTGIDFVGYYCPHPLESVAVLKVQFIKELPGGTEEALTWLQGELHQLMETLNEHCNEWCRLTGLTASNATAVATFLNRLEDDDGVGAGAEDADDAE